MGNITSSQMQLAHKALRPINFLILALALYGVRVVRRAIKLRGELAGIGSLPGTRYIYGPYTLLGRLLPPIPYISRAPGWQFMLKYQRERTSD
jgi:hypothetical protein